MKRLVVTVVSVAALVVATGITVRHFLGERLDKAQQAVVTANALADAADARTEQAMVALDLVAAQRDSARADARRASVRAAERGRALALQRAATDSLVAAAADTCDPVIEALEADVDSALALAEGWRQAYLADSAAAVRSDFLASGYLQSLNETREALARLQAASGALVEASQEPFLARLLPESGIGVTAGFSPLSQRFDVVIGYTLHW